MTISALIKFATGSVPRVFGAPINSLRRLQIAFAFLCVATAALGQEPVNPLKPLDLASPRATLKTFLESGDAVGAYLAQDYLPSPSRTKFNHLFLLAKTGRGMPQPGRGRADGSQKGGLLGGERIVRNIEPDPASAV